MKLLKNIALIILLIAIIVASFWISFMLGKKILVPVQKVSLKETFQVPTKEIEALLPPQITFEVEELKEIKPEKEEPKVELKKEKIEVTVKKEIKKIPDTIGNYQIQLGAFKNKNNANSLVTSLKKKGFQTQISKDGILYKVFLKESFNLWDAKSELADLKAAGFDGMIIKR